AATFADLAGRRAIALLPQMVFEVAFARTLKFGAGKNATPPRCGKTCAIKPTRSTWLKFDVRALTFSPTDGCTSSAGRVKVSVEADATCDLDNACARDCCGDDCDHAGRHGVGFRRRA